MNVVRFNDKLFYSLENKEILVSCSTIQGTYEQRGLLQFFKFPGSMRVRDLETREKFETDFPFAGLRMGIQNIKFEDEIVYINPFISDKYPLLSIEEEYLELNKFRTKCFGPGYELN